MAARGAGVPERCRGDAALPGARRRARDARDGGNAVDAAFAANLVLGVVTPYMCGFGGDLLAMVWDGDASTRTAASGGARPGATPDGRARAVGSRRRCRCSVRTRCTVPGAVDGWFTLIETFGTRSFGELAQRALRYAEDGFPVTRRGAFFFNAIARCTTTSGCTTSRDAYGDVDAGSVDPPARARAARSARSPTTDPTRTTAARSAPRSRRRCSAPAAS